ncbi:hypothetical protein GGR92_003670 [Spirosoma lacussanchae]|nr:hypothetical protein [Spirosoma lacussanchae]
MSTITILYPASLEFSIGRRTVTLEPDMSLADARLINEQYRGLYLAISEPEAPALEPGTEAAPAEKAPTGRTGRNRQSAK